MGRRSIAEMSAKTKAGSTSARKREMTDGPKATGAAAAAAAKGIHSQRTVVTARKVRAMATPAQAAREYVGTTQRRPRPVTSHHHPRRTRVPTPAWAAATGVVAAR